MLRVKVAINCVLLGGVFAFCWFVACFLVRHLKLCVLFAVYCVMLFGVLFYVCVFVLVCCVFVCLVCD